MALTAFSFKVQLPPFKTPAVRVTIPVNVWVIPIPKFNVPPEPLIVNALPLIFPNIVAVPAVLVNVTFPVVVKLPIDCIEVVPPIVIPPEPLVIVPLLIKFP